MRNPHQHRRTRLVRRVLSHHGSDCCHPDDRALDDGMPYHWRTIRTNRCIILTRVDYLDSRPSEAWLSGDWGESRQYQAKRHTFDPTMPTWYGGGFWEHVQIDPPTAAQWLENRYGKPWSAVRYSEM